MDNIEKVKNQIVNTKVTDIRTLITSSTKELGKALPSHMSAERLVRIALTTLRLNPELYNCTPESFLGALFQSAQLGLEPNVEGQAYILPFKNNKKVNGEWRTTLEAQFSIGFKGYAELFYRHDKSLSLDMQIVKEKDDFDYQYGTDSYLHHKPIEGDRGPVKGYYAVAKLASGASLFRYMSYQEAMDFGKKFSKCYDKEKQEFYRNTPWATNPDAMCMKTVLRQLMKLLPKSIEIQRAIAMDETIKTRVDKDMFAVPDKTNWENGEIVEPKQVEEKLAEQRQGTDETNAYKSALNRAQRAKKELGDETYYQILKKMGYQHSNDIKHIDDFIVFFDECDVVKKAKEKK